MPAAPPRPDPKPATQPSPYQLRSDARHAAAAERQRRQRDEAERRRRAASAFKARPAPPPGARPFEPEASGAPLTVPEDVALRTSARAPRREAFDRAMAEKLAALEEEKRRQDALKRRREDAAEEAERARHRFRARPAPDFDRLELLPAATPRAPTAAKSPLLATARRAARPRGGGD